MSPETGFTTFFLVTLALLGGVVVTGRAARRRAHVALVVTTLASLGVAIAYAKDLGTVYDLEAAGWVTPVHLLLAKVTTAAFVLPIATGLWTLKHPERIAWHRPVAYTVLALTVASAATGTWMILAAERLVTVGP